MMDALVPTANPALEASGATASAVASTWLRSFSSPQTQRAYESDLRRWGLYLVGLGVDPLEAKRPHVDDFARLLEEAGRSASTIRRSLAALSSYYTYAVGEELIDRSPVAAVRRPKREAVHQTLGLDRGELAALLVAAEDKGPRDFALVSLLAFNGLRISEALGAAVEDLDRERGHRTLSVHRKGAVRALVPLAPRTAVAIDSYLSGRDTGPLFVTATGRPIHRDAAAKGVCR